MSRPLQEPLPAPGNCRAARERAREVLLIEAAESLPPEVQVHADGCPGCRSRIEEMVLVEAALSGAYRTARETIPDPSPERLEAILDGRAPGWERTLPRIRRTVNRMLILTVLILSLLPLVALAWILLRLIQRVQGQ